jgi:hypothetical protein
MLFKIVFTKKEQLDFANYSNTISLRQLSAEPLSRIGLPTSSLPRKCSTTELQRLYGNERETGLEPATYSLEGYRSTK